MANGRVKLAYGDDRIKLPSFQHILHNHSLFQKLAGCFRSEGDECAILVVFG